MKNKLAINISSNNQAIDSYRKYRFVPELMSILIHSIIIFSFLLPEIIQAQGFFKPGAVWHFEFMNVNNIGFRRLRYEGDTLIQNKSFQMITSFEVMVGWDPFIKEYYVIKQDYYFPLFFHTDQDTIWYYDIQNGDMLRYGVLNLSIGNSWNVGMDTSLLECGPTIAIVDSVGVQVINGMPLNFSRIHTTLPTASLNYSGLLCERIGLIGRNYMIPSLNVCIDGSGFCPTDFYFTCYYDPELGLYNSRPSQDCEHWLILTDRESEIGKSDDDLFVWPNPAKNLLFITGVQASVSPTEFSLYNSAGSLVKQSLLNLEDGFSLDVSNLPKGIYSIRIQNMEHIYQRKIILD